MSGILLVILGVSVGVLTLFLWLRWRRNGTDAGESQPTATAPDRTRTPARGQSPAPEGLKRRLARKFHGVSVKPGPGACAAARDLVGQRFLPEEAPAMPLAACDQQKCVCAYSHHASRRDAEDRRSGWGGFGGFTPTVPGGNRRGKGRERRLSA